MKKVAPQVKMILADPQGSVLADLVNSGKTSKPGKWLVEGIGEDFVPSICDLSLAAEAITVTDAQSFQAARELLTKEGILAGSSTGTQLYAALEYCRRQTEPKRVVTVACDTGNKYLSKMFDNEWMWNHGFIKREEFGDLRDIIARPYHYNATTTISPNEPLATAQKHMVTYGISQLPVMDGEKLLGLVCDADLLQSIYSDGDFNKPVKEIMMVDIGTVPHTTSIDILSTLFNKYSALVVMREAEFLGLITPIDMINYLKRQQQK